MKAKYIGKPKFKGINHNSMYEVSFVESRTGLAVEVLQDLTNDIVMDGWYPYSNQKSLELNWKVEES